MSQLRLRTRRLTVLCLLTAVVALAVPGWAAAEPPARLDTQITDQVGALAGRESEVDQALQQLRQDTGWRLFVVYVADFDGVPALDWADQTAVASSLGARDALLAVAVVERAYAYSVDDRFPLTDDQLDEVAATAIEPALSADDWAGAAIGAADGYRQAAASGAGPQPGTRPGAGDSGAEPAGATGNRVGLVMCLVTLAGAVIALVAWAWWYRRDQRRHQVDTAIAGGPHPELSTEELTAQANTLLIDTDNAVTAADGELGLTTAQYGAAATASFSEALAAARADLAEAFRLRAQLDEPAQASDPAARELARRQLLAGIIARCTAGSDRLAAESAAFDALRDLENRLDQVVDELATRQRQAGQRLPTARSELAELVADFTGPVLDSVDGNVAQAEQLLSFASAELDRAIELAGGDERSAAAVAVRTAGDALVQVDTLLAALTAAGIDLRAAHTAIAGLMTEVASDLAAGQGALRGGAQSTADPAGSPATAPAGAVSTVPAAEAAALASAVAGAEQVLGAVREQLVQRPMDPVAALRQLEAADRALDAALGAVRDAAQRVARARAVLPQAILAARAEITAASSFIGTRRGAVGGTARYQLAEAQRLLDQAIGAEEADPVQALASAHRADQLAERALQAARSDVQRWAPPAGAWGDARSTDAGTGAFLGGLLGSSGQRHGWSNRSTSNFSSSSARRSTSSSRRSSSGGVSRRGSSGSRSSGGRRGGGSSGGRRGGGGRF